ncbi:MAG: oxidoreductase [Planctomycetaceae bacterium]|nr:oxidoreductase [Planctomycetaceae bacterium]|tara:strand:- start:1156 stop:1884 length:729 start_codon:yes stop_codon:yes gene_type:complete
MRKVILITGSSRRRVGFHLGKHLIDNGYQVVLHGLNNWELGEQIAEELGEHACFEAADITCDKQVAELVMRITERFGCIDGLVTLASVWNPTPLRDLTAEQIRKQLMVNALGTVLCAQKVGMQMVKQVSGGAIVTVGDWAVDRPYTGYISYFLSKGGLDTATKALAVELAALNENIRVNCIHPGNILFPDDLSPEKRSEIQTLTPTHWVNDPLDFCRAVLFLLENRMTTGTSVKLDSGRSLV